MRTRLRWKCLVLLLLLSPGLRAELHEVAIQGFAYLPATITIKAGDTVRWVNREKRQFHNVWFLGKGEPEPEYLFPDERYEMVFPEKGTFHYRCGPHEEMKGTVVVE